MRRRALLAGIGLSSVGVGAAFGSGAFTTVSANRTVDLSVENDADARIGFGPGTGASGVIETSTDDDSADVITFSQSDLNEQAKTLFEDALTVTNNGESGDPAVEIYVKEVSNVGTESSDALDFQTATDNTSIVGSTNADELATDGGSVSLDIVVDLRNGANKTALESITEVTFIADAKPTNN
ncbi:hypothetical protein [Halorubrum coriense]|uniref:hypothetical protein n=1 Tax=Halorubrum coriense TaxID=64713 RepID=UPI0009B59B0E|nr:hypothetical protein [Halorubrum coriense]